MTTTATIETVDDRITRLKLDDISAGPDLPACLTVDELKLVCQAREYYAERRAA